MSAIVLFADVCCCLIVIVIGIQSCFSLFDDQNSILRSSKTHANKPDKNVATMTMTTTAAASAIDDGSSNNQSEYEQLRARNIVRNNARLRSLGLITRREEARSNAHALGKTVVDDDKPAEKEEKESDGEWTQSPKKKKQKRRNNQEEPSRKSLRLQGITPNVQITIGPPLDTPEERQERVRECREVRLRAAKAVAEAGAEKAAKENPTATYEHCLMRVKSMSDKALANRVKAIERAAGKHCVVKMAIFKSCLQDEDMWDLAKLASDALERLKALQPPPEE